MVILFLDFPKVRWLGRFRLLSFGRVPRRRVCRRPRRVNVRMCMGEGLRFG